MNHMPTFTVFRFCSVLILLMVTASGCDYWNQRTAPRTLPTEKTIDIETTTTQELANKGKNLIFGAPGKSHEAGDSGKAQCTVCHSFQPEQPSKRAPNLWGITARHRIKRTTIEYIAESHVCPSCYVAAGWGLNGSQGCESPMPKVHLPPIDLTLEELVAVDTWIYVHEGETPPSPQSIQSAYKAILSKEEWRYVTRDTQNANDTGTSEKQLFLKHACTGCHIVPGIPGATGKLGPPLYMKAGASARLKDPAYRGHASTPREYIAESILYHDIYVVTDQSAYAQNTLPSSHYRNKIRAEDLHQMVQYLLNLEKGDQTQFPYKTAVEKCLQNKDS